jgi:hypothetical protein
MSFATLLLATVVLVPLTLLVIDLFRGNTPDPLAAPARGLSRN